MCRLPVLARWCRPTCSNCRELSISTNRDHSVALAPEASSPELCSMELDINSAIKKGFFQQVRFLVRFGHGVNKRDADGRTPLINCAFVDDERWAVGLARTLIESGARVGLTDRAGVTALHYACMLGRSALVQVFLKALDFDLNQPDRYGQRTIHCCCVMLLVPGLTYNAGFLLNKLKSDLSKIDHALVHNVMIALITS